MEESHLDDGGEGGTGADFRAVGGGVHAPNLTEQRRRGGSSQSMLRHDGQQEVRAASRRRWDGIRGHGVEGKRRRSVAAG